VGRIQPAVVDESRVAFRRLFGSRARTFSFAARFLPEGRRLAVESLYAFCRTVDDLADEYPTGVGRPLLDEWWQWVDGLERRRPGPPPPPAPDRPGDENLHLTAALRDVVERFGVPPRSLRLLVEGVRSDTERTTIGTFVELQEYCYRVAGTVGVALCHVLGATSPEAYERAARLGMAMQLTNVLRDVGEDLGRGRVYLPAEDLDRFDGAAAALGARRVTPPFVSLMRYEMARARSYYAAGIPGVYLLPAECRLPILVAGRLYRAILGRIEAQGYDVFSRRAATSRAQKVLTVGGAILSLRTERRRRSETATAPATTPALAELPLRGLLGEVRGG
jgi:phytoene synthase